MLSYVMAFKTPKILWNISEEFEINYPMLTCRSSLIVIPFSDVVIKQIVMNFATAN